MENKGEDFPGNSPPGRNNNNVRGGQGLPNNNMFPPNLRAIDPQYAAALDFEELRIRHQLEVQQDIELRRRLMEEQQHQLLSELEYRNKIQQLQELQELQAQQQQQQGLSQLLAQNPHLLELHQQQQYGHDNALLSSLRDDFLLQRHQLMLQDQMAQQLQDQLSRDSQQHEQEELLAILQASENLRGVLPSTDGSSRRQQGAIAQQAPHDHPPSCQSKPPPAEPENTQQIEQITNRSNRERVDLTPNDQGRAHPQTDLPNGTRKRSLSDFKDVPSKGSPQDPPIIAAKNSQPEKEEPPQVEEPAKETETEEVPVEEKSAKDKELDERVAKLLESQKLPTAKKKDRGSSEKRGRKKKSKMEEPSSKRGGKKKKSAASQEGKKAPKKDEQLDDGSKLSDHEKSAIDFLGSRGTKNGKATKKSKIDPAGCTEVGSRKSEVPTKGSERDDKEAANIVLNFKCLGVSSSEVQNVKTWGKENQDHESTDVSQEESPYLSPGLKFNLPSLPIEPEHTSPELTYRPPSATDKRAPSQVTGESNESNSVATPPANAAEDTSTIRFIGQQKKIFKPKRASKGLDEWWPSNASIRKERRKRGEREDEEGTDEELDAAAESRPEISFVKAGVEAAKDRLATSVEPGVLEKLPHCKLYDEFCKDKKSGDIAPKFCCQTTETFPSEIMVCCSICSTWRHAQCGGHYKRYTADSVDPSNILFEPVCDQCYLEKPFLLDKPVATTRIDRQRTEHLRRCNATNAVMRQAAFGKHSGQYKWPLGSVSLSHISGHTRSVQARHEKAEKQWSEMANRLSGGQELRPRERQRVRTREFERLLVSVEDAERATDRHNMTLFLQNDTSKLHPAGFEVARRNIFDPEDDPICAPVHADLSKSLDGSNDGVSDNNRDSQADALSIVSQIDETMGMSLLDMKGLKTNSLRRNAEKRTDDSADKDRDLQVKKGQVCAREGCDHKPRFDSIFCSDSCGVSTLEADLLLTLQFSNKLHPSVLR